MLLASTRITYSHPTSSEFLLKTFAPPVFARHTFRFRAQIRLSNIQAFRVVIQSIQASRVFSFRAGGSSEQGRGLTLGLPLREDLRTLSGRDAPVGGVRRREDETGGEELPGREQCNREQCDRWGGASRRGGD